MSWFSAAMFLEAGKNNTEKHPKNGPFLESFWYLVECCMIVWAVISDEQTSKGWPFSLLKDEQMSNKVGVEHQPVVYTV